MSRAKLARVASSFLIEEGKRFRLKDVDPDDTRGLPVSKEDANDLLRQLVGRMAALQETLYAQDRWGVLLIFQAMDAAGKDSAIKHVFSGLNPQGVQVFSFKAPSSEEVDHDYLWRTSVRLPERGRIGVFNRSHYEEVLVVRVHPELLESERLPGKVVTKHIWQERFADINNFELHLARNGYVVRKFFLHVSKEEQARRFLSRLDEPDKRWKFSMGDIRERERWDEYMDAYEDAIRHTSQPHAPWIVVPADRKWFARLIVASTILEALEQLDLKPPEVSGEQERELAAVRKVLASELEPKGKERRGGRRRS